MDGGKPPLAKTVSVPAAFTDVFAKAQEYVARYFAERVDDPEHGKITISGERYVLVRAASLSVEFFDLVKSMYQDQGEEAARRVASNLLFDLAHAIGKADARIFHARMQVTNPVDKLSAGPSHFSHSGWAFVDIHPESVPSPDENYYLIYDHPYSFESDSWLQRARRSDGPVCIMNAGYSSGWCEESFGIPLVAAEVECLARGDQQCRFIMAPPGRIEEHLERYAKQHQHARSDSYTAPGQAVEIPEFFQRKRMEEALRESHAQLEDRVQKRTAELESANACLQSEIIDRRRAEQARHESEELYRQLVENASDIIFSLDLNGQITSCNRAGEELLGYTREEAQRLNWRDLIVPDQRQHVEHLWNREPGSEETNPFEVAVLTKTGRRRTLELSTRVIYQAGLPSGLLGIARDVTQRRQLEEQLRQAQKMEAVGRLAGGVAHDFNNLLMVVRGNCDLLLADLAPDSSQAALAREIQKGAGRATALTRQLLAFSRKQVMAPKILDLNAVVLDMAKMINRLIGEDIALIPALAPNLGSVQADPSQIEQVILNLAVNARDAMPNGGRLILETSNVDLEGPLDATFGKPVTVASGPYVLLSVNDNGPGMDEATRERIFEPFFTTKPLGQGTGLGLATVYGIVKQSGGYIWVYSEPGLGTTFKIYLPRVEGTAAPLTHPEAPEQPFGGSETVLLAEDEPALRKLAQRVLEGHGYTVLEAQDGPAALTVAGRHPGSIDLLVTDVVMPGMSGRDLARQLRGLYPEMQVLFMSGYSDEAIASNGSLDPGSILMQKPFGATELARKVRELLDQGKAK